MTCKECKGTGVYQGLFETSPCRTCQKTANIYELLNKEKPDKALSPEEIRLKNKISLSRIFSAYTDNNLVSAAKEFFYVLEGHSGDHLDDYITFECLYLALSKRPKLEKERRFLRERFYHTRSAKITDRFNTKE